MSEPNFSLGSNFEVKNSVVNEYFWDKTQLMDQEVGIFLNWRTKKPKNSKETNRGVSKFINIIQEPPRSGIFLGFWKLSPNFATV